MTENTLDRLQDFIGYGFQNSQFLLEALTHSSYAQEAPERCRDNEQLEFLGDAVLNFVVSVALVRAFPEWEEGQLTRARARLVAATHLARVGTSLELGSYLRLGRGEEKTGGRNKSALFVNALEALVAAIFLDGGLEPAEGFVKRFIFPASLVAAGEELFSVDYKSGLQEYLQSARKAPAEYQVVEETGPEHQKTFTVEVVAGEDAVARGRGTSKKAAEQEAARAALERLREKTVSNG
jgi:ribonuclease-3